MLKARDLLLYLVIKYEGRYDDILFAIQNKLPFEKTEAIGIGKKVKSKYVTIMDSDYPKCLKNVYHPPLVLFYYGDLSLLDDIDKNVAVVGSRNYSPYGEKMTKEIVTSLSSNFNIVSGLAKGIDSIAHSACIKNKGKTIGILGCGIDYIYPKENYELIEEVKNNHLLISEYPNVIPPQKDNFPLRNRLIACVSKGVIITEASVRSGTMITASHAVCQGKEVLCVPYTAESHSGCNHLIKEGAYLIEDADDALAILKK